MTLSHESAGLWQRASAYAAFKHRHQLRKDGKTPYISHPFRVAMAVRHVFGCDDPVALAAALMHDLIEDTQTDYDDIQERFGDEVAGLVSTLTKNMAMPDAPREAEYDARLAAGDWRARLIKLGDVYDNIADSIESKQTPEFLADMIDKAERALVLGKPDEASHPETARAMAEVRESVRIARARKI